MCTPPTPPHTSCVTHVLCIHMHTGLMCSRACLDQSSSRNLKKYLLFFKCDINNFHYCNEKKSDKISILDKALF